MTSRRAPIFGPEPWQGEWSHWDLWMCVVAVLDHDGDLAGLERQFVAELHGDLSFRRAGEEKLSHLTDLRRRLDAAGLEPTAVARDADLEDKRVVAKARRKVDDRSIEGRAMTEAMRETPRVVLARRARYGHWGAFPSSPAPFYDRFRVAVEVKDLVTKGRTFKKTETLEARLHRLDGPRRSLPDRLALYRAFHTAGLELADRADDSYGVIGTMRNAAWHEYLAIDWAAVGMEPEVYWHDLCELVVWERYGLGFREETLPFQRVPDDQADLVESILVDLEAEHRQAHLDYEADEALQQIAWLHVAAGRVERYQAVAARLGTDHWIPIVTMARSALEIVGRDEAARVFRAADRPGFHQGHLRKQCREMTGVDLRDDRGSHLRVVE